MTELKKTSVEYCSECGLAYNAVQSKQACPHCGTIQPSCEACSQSPGVCSFCKNGDQFEESVSDDK